MLAWNGGSLTTRIADYGLIGAGSGEQIWCEAKRTEQELA